MLAMEAHSIFPRRHLKVECTCGGCIARQLRRLHLKSPLLRDNCCEHSQQRLHNKSCARPPLQLCPKTWSNCCGGMTLTRFNRRILSNLDLSMLTKYLAILSGSTCCPLRIRAQHSSICDKFSSGGNSGRNPLQSIGKEGAVTSTLIPNNTLSKKRPLQKRRHGCSRHRTSGTVSHNEM